MEAVKDPLHETTATGTERAAPPFDHALARLAARQHGVVSLAQLERLGLAPSSVRTRLANGRLHRVHRGVYSVGHPLLERHGRLLAAVLSCGEGALLSHRSAAELWGLGDHSGPSIEVTTPGRARRSRAGVRVHGGTLRSSEAATVEGIPCTTVPRTLLDLADAADRRLLERSIDRAEALRLFDGRAVEDVLRHARGRTGARHLASVLAELNGGCALTRSELEERFLALCTNHCLPRPCVNAWLVDCGAEVDFLWPCERLWWRPTAMRSTARARPSSTIARVTVGSSWPAFAWRASPGGRSSRIHGRSQGR